MVVFSPLLLDFYLVSGFLIEFSLQWSKNVVCFPVAYIHLASLTLKVSFPPPPPFGKQLF